MTDADPTALQAALGRRFADPGLLKRALTHRSGAAGVNEDYERLEFLGDRVLALCIVDMLMTAYPQDPEGVLSRRLSFLVCRDALVESATAAGLQPHIILGRAEGENGPNPAITADVCEAVIGALYLDGGLAAARAFIERFWSERLQGSATPRKDAKSTLQEWAMAQGLPLPDYQIIDKTGPEHAPEFTVRLSVRGIDAVEARGPSRRTAERRAAAILLQRLRESGGKLP